jgi:transposase
MKFIQGKPRNQWEMYCLDEHVDADNEVRLIDRFVNSLNLAELGFKTQYEENGRPAYCNTPQMLDPKLALLSEDFYKRL